MLEQSFDPAEWTMEDDDRQVLFDEDVEILLWLIVQDEEDKEHER